MCLIDSTLNESIQLYKGAWDRLALTGEMYASLVPARNGTVNTMLSHLQQGTKSKQSAHGKWITENRDWLEYEFSFDFVAWLYSWRILISRAGFKVPVTHNKLSWSRWYFSILGNPPDTIYPFPATEWPITLYWSYMRRMTSNRRMFEAAFSKQHSNHTFQSGTDSWKDWHNYQALYGLDAVWKEWVDSETDHYETMNMAVI